MSTHNTVNRHRVGPEFIGSPRNCVPMAFTAKSRPGTGPVVLKVALIAGAAFLCITIVLPTSVVRYYMLVFLSSRKIKENVAQLFVLVVPQKVVIWILCTCYYTQMTTRSGSGCKTRSPPFYFINSKAHSKRSAALFRGHRVRRTWNRDVPTPRPPVVLFKKNCQRPFYYISGIYSSYSPVVSLSV